MQATLEVLINKLQFPCSVVEIGLPIPYFICYGGSKGQRVALKIRSMPLERELFMPFLAEPDSRDLMSGAKDFYAEIDKQIIGSQIMVVVGTCDIQKSKDAMREIRLAESQGVHIIGFVQKECRKKLQKILKNPWLPIVYSARTPESSFDKLRFDIVTTCLRIANTATAKGESYERY